MSESKINPLGNFNARQHIGFFSLNVHVSQYLSEQQDNTDLPRGYITPEFETYLASVIESMYLAGWEAYHSVASAELFERGLGPGSWNVLTDAVAKYEHDKVSQ